MGNKDICGIYGYYDNLKDKIVYVGQSTKIRNRHKQHLMPSAKYSQPFNKILQSNTKRYDLLILKECDISKLNYWEITLIALFNPLFNFNNGGDGNRGFHHSDKTKQLLSNKLKGRIVSDEERRKKSGANHHLFGKKHKLETIKKMREVKLGSKNPMYGRKQSESAKEKVRQHKLGAKNPNYKWYPTITRNGMKGNKQMYCIQFHHKKIKSSIDLNVLKEYLEENYDKILNNEPLPSIKDKLINPSVVKVGYAKQGQRWGVYYNKQMFKTSYSKQEMEQYLVEHYDEIVNGLI